VPNVSDTEDIKERITQARKLFVSMRKQLLSNKQIPIDIRRRLYQATGVNIALWGCESRALKEADRSKLEIFHHQCLRKWWTMWDVHERRIRNERVRRTVANSPTMESMTQMRRCRWLCKLSFMKASRSPRLIHGAWCPTPRPPSTPSSTKAPPTECGETVIGHQDIGDDDCSSGNTRASQAEVCGPDNGNNDLNILLLTTRTSLSTFSGPLVGALPAPMVVVKVIPISRPGANSISTTTGNVISFL
jgi:hypothetical protein